MVTLVVITITVGRMLVMMIKRSLVGFKSAVTTFELTKTGIAKKV